MAAESERVGDASEDMEEEEVATDFKTAILRRPDLLAALQGHLHSEVMQNLPAPVKRRIKALKKIQLETTHLEAKFYEEVHELECKYHALYSPHYEKRGTIVQGLYEPNDDECDFPSDDEEKEELANDIKTKVKIEDVSETKEPATEEEKNKANAKGIPDFWLTIFKNVGILAEMVQERDEPILKHLIDVKVIFLKEPMGFVLEFHFSHNEYFSNSVLTKEYEMKCVPDESDPFNFEGPEIYKCKGCTIDWRSKEKNVTMEMKKKRQKHKQRGSVRVVDKPVPKDSFFNFFKPPVMPEDPDAEVDEDTQSLLTSDFEIGHYIRERIVPRAVLFYTGEALEDEEDFEEEEEGDDEDDEDEEGEDDDPDFDPADPKVPKGKKAQNPAECKQQ